MKIRIHLLISCTICVLFTAAATRAQTGGGDSTLQVMVGKSIVINSQEPLKRVSVSDPAIASPMIVSPNQVLIHGQMPGTVTLMLWDDQERSRSYDLEVDADITNLRRAMQDVFPDEKIVVTQSGSAVVLNGNVSSKPVADRAAALAQTQAKNVVNMLQTAETRDVISLQVRFAEVDRAAITQYGFNIFSTGATNTIGSITTQQFGTFAGNNGKVPSNVTRGRDPETPSLVSGGIGESASNTPSVFGLTDLLNIFLFRPDINLGAAIKALQQRNILQILAEPNLLAMNGAESSFLAGGEFPFPVLQGGTTFNAVTIAFKEFGVRLKFRPIIQSDGTIRLKVAPEVSSLDFSNALTVSGFVIPALSTRRAETEVELRDGQSFAIAGLMDNRLTETASKIPGLGNIPILGKFFTSAAKNRNNSELLVVVTPKLVRALEPGQVPPGPEFPKSFLDRPKFDGKASTDTNTTGTATADSQVVPGRPQNPPKASGKTGLPFELRKED
jgi:pilus assembly protein CpaC